MLPHKPRLDQLHATRPRRADTLESARNAPRKHPRLLPALLVLLVWPLLAGFTPNAEAYRAHFTAFADTVFPAKGCEDISAAGNEFLANNTEQIKQDTAALSAAIDQIQDRPTFQRLQNHLQETLDIIVASPEALEMFECLRGGGPTSEMILAFDNITTAVVGEAVARASVRVQKNEEAARPADMALATVAANELARLGGHFEALVELHQPDCPEVSRAMLFWLYTYENEILRADGALRGELGRMTPEERNTIQTDLDALAASAQTTGKILGSCSKQLSPEAAGPVRYASDLVENQVSASLAKLQSKGPKTTFTEKDDIWQKDEIETPSFLK